jgi:hypothetical protein
MLYNPQWKVRTAPFSLENLIAWLETQPQEKSYNWHDCSGRCLIGQWVRSLGAIGDGWAKAYNTVAPSIRHEIAMPIPHTFGAALMRARKLAVTS